MAQETGGEYLLEFRRVGNSVKVSAIDPITAEEVSIVGPANIGQEELSRVAVRKLKYVMKKKLPKVVNAEVPSVTARR